MLHGSRDKVGNGDHVLLWQRIGDVEVVLEEVGDIGTDVERILESIPLSRGSIDPEQGLVDVCQLLLVLEIAHDEAGQVGHHRHRLLELQREHSQDPV